MIRGVLLRYLARELYGAVLLVLVAFLGLFAFFDLLNELDSIGKNDGYQLTQAAIYVAMLLPGRVYELLPVCVLIGALYALTTLARHSEITVMRAAGLSTRTMLQSLAVLGLPLVLMTFVFGEYIAPPAERAAQQWRLTATSSTVSQDLRSGLWVKDGNRFVNVRIMMPDRTLKNVRVYEFDKNFALEAISEAQEGRYEAGKGWRLRDVALTRFFGDHTEVAQVESLYWVSDLTPDVLSVLMVVPERMSVGALYAYVRHLKENAQQANRYEIALWKKFTYPLAALVMLALALPFAYSHDRMGGVSVKVFGGIMLGVGFHLLNGLSSNLGVINSWPPLVAAVTPAALFMLAAAAMLWRVERR